MIISPIFLKFFELRQAIINYGNFNNYKNWIHCDCKFINGLCVKCQRKYFNKNINKKSYFFNKFLCLYLIAFKYNIHHKLNKFFKVEIKNNRIFIFEQDIKTNKKCLISSIHKSKIENNYKTIYDKLVNILD